MEVVEAGEKLGAAQLGRLVEAVDEDVVRHGLVPARVEVADARREVGARAVPGRLGRDVLGDAVVDAVEGLDKVAVHLEPQLLDDGRLDGLAEHGRDDLLAVVPAGGEGGTSSQHGIVRRRCAQERDRRRT